MLFLQLLVNGIQVGALYALTSVGFSLIYGSTRIFHFAHGATFTIAAYIFYSLNSVHRVSWVLAALCASLAAVAFGVMLNRLVYAPIQQRHGSLFTIFVASFGAGIVVQNIIGMVFGRSFVSVPNVLSNSIELIPGLFVSPLAGVSIVCTLAFLLGLQFLLMRTHVGIALRALSENPDLVRAYGMSTRWLSTVVFALGSLMVVPASLLTGMATGLNPAAGHHVMLVSLASTIVGGVGSLRGAALAGLLLGVAENLALFAFDTQWSEAVTFVVLFLFIVFRPSGFAGRAVTT